MSSCPVCKPTSQRAQQQQQQQQEAQQAQQAAQGQKAPRQRARSDFDSPEPASEFDLENVDWDALEKLAIEVRYIRGG